MPLVGLLIAIASLLIVGAGVLREAVCGSARRRPSQARPLGGSPPAGRRP